jgi:beta-glucosidase
MLRRDALKLIGAGFLPFVISGKLKALNKFIESSLKASDFKKFTWGISSAAAQVEGAWDTDGKGPSIWDSFSKIKGKIKDGATPEIACDFYNRYPQDIELVKQLGFGANRFSVSWPRIIPLGTGQINQKGIDFYNRVIDKSLEKGIEPWVTLYHWDLPQALEDQGGWTNREIVNWFSDYASLCAKSFGDRVKHWIVLNEPLSFTGLGYGNGYHAPGLKGLGHFLPAVHHAVLCQAEGGRILRNEVANAFIGSAFSCSPIDPQHRSKRDEKAARRLDAFINRLFAEPAVGMGYPFEYLHFLKKIEKYIKPGDEEKMKFNFDFFGLQYYFRIVADFSIFNPILWANQVPPIKRHVPLTEMNWEVYPDGMYRVLKQFSKYPVKEFVITENGAAFKDILLDDQVNDLQRTKFFQDYLQYLLKAKNEGINVTGYFAWSLLDNFEWVEGFYPRFGLVYVDHKSQERIIKNSGKWFSEFLRE